MFFGRSFLAVVLVGLFFLPVAAETWHVEADGTGDFSVIQDAVDAASDGDIIAIGPGRYDQYATHSGAHLYVYIVGKQLTLAGAGPDVTFIGPADPQYHPRPGPDVYLVYSSQASGLTIRDLTLEHSPCRHVFTYNARIEVDNCIVRGIGDGITVYNPYGGFIRGSTFDGLMSPYPTAISIHDPEQGVVIEDCRFEGVGDGVFIDGGDAPVEVRDCIFEKGQNGCGFQLGATGSITGCRFRDTSNYAIIMASGPITITDNIIEQDSGWGMYLVSSYPATVRQNVIATRTGSCLFVYTTGENLEFHDNHLIRGGSAWGPNEGGFFAKTPNYWPYATAHVDLSYNYWGTTDLDEIATYIEDGNDLENVSLYIDYEPIADGPVETQKHSWDGVKAFYRD